MAETYPDDSNPPRWGHLLFLILVLPVLGGMLASLAFAPARLGAAALLSALPALMALRRLRLGWAALAALFYGTSATVAVAPWVYVAMHEHYHFGVLASGAFNVLVVGLGVGLYFGAALVLWRLMVGGLESDDPAWMRGRGWLVRPLLAGACFFLAEWLRTHGAWSMPWGLLGAGLLSWGRLVQVADLIGALGLSFVCALVAALGAEALEALLRARAEGNSLGRAVLAPLLVALGVLGACWGYGALRLAGVQEEIARAQASEAPLRVALVQANVPQEARWRADLVPVTMGAHIELSREAAQEGPTDLIVWPETAMNIYISDPANPYRRQIHQIAYAHKVHFLMGGPANEPGAEGQPRYYNAIYALDPLRGLRAKRYDKIQLLPFAEYNPFGDVPLLPRPKQVPRDYSPGTALTLFEIKGAKIGGMICFEALYPWLARAFVGRGAEVLLNISNDAWFMRTKAPHQHVDQARLRAIELRRYLIRSAGTGVSAVIDPVGRYAAGPTEIFTRQVLRGEVWPMKMRSPYARWGDGPLWLMSLALVLLGGGLGLRGRRRGR